MKRTTGSRKFTSTGTFLAQWGTQGSGAGQFSFPHSIAADHSFNIYVTDTGNNRVEKFTSAGAFVTSWGSSGTGDGQFFQPLGIAIDGSTNVYVVDNSNHRVQKFTSSGTFLTKWGSQQVGAEDSTFQGDPGFTPGLFMSVCDLAVDLNDANRLYASDPGNHRVQEFDPNGGLLDAWGGFGTNPGQFEGTGAIAVDNTGFLYVLDVGNNRLQKFLRSDLVSVGAMPQVPRTLSASPNPSSVATRLVFELKRSREVELVIMDASGRLVRRLLQGSLPAGVTTATWDLRTESGARVRPGVFLARLNAAGESRIARVFVLP
jgi:DNA-binding beta-propeller fold protein YncE